MLHKKSEKGQALVLIAFAAVGLFAFTALSVDGGRVFSDRRHAQNAADTAALAAALARVRADTDPDGAAKLSGEARAESNGYANDTDSTVEVNFCNEPGIDCQGLGLPEWVYAPTTDPVQAALQAEEKSKYIRVKITSIVRTTFARIIGWQQVTNVLTAVAKAELGGLGPLFDGSALVALAREGDATITNVGNVHLEINDSGVFNNSSDNCAFIASGNSYVNVAPTSGFTIANNGTQCNNLNGPNDHGNVVDGSMYRSGTQMEYPPVFNPPIPVPNINCSGTGIITQDATRDHYTVHPGNFGRENFTRGIYTFMSGSFCFDGGLSIGGSAQVTANYVAISITRGDFNVTSNLNCNSLLVHINGGSGITVNGNNHVVCHNATFFASTGSVSLEGTGTQNIFTAPTGGAFPFTGYPEYKNLLVFMPYGNTKALKITGNSGTTMTGSIIGVSAPVTLTGNNDFVLNSSITGFTITLAGAANTTINYIPGEQITQLDPSAIALTK